MGAHFFEESRFLNDFGNRANQSLHILWWDDISTQVIFNDLA